jgi:hypothetical protein
MEQAPSCEANSFSPSQEITRLLWNPKVQVPSLWPRYGAPEEDGLVQLQGLKENVQNCYTVANNW